MLSRQCSSCLLELHQLALDSINVSILRAECATLYLPQQLQWADQKI